MVSPVLSVVSKSHCAGHKITQIILIVYKNSCKVFKRDVYHQTGWQALIDICIYYVSNCFVKTNLCSVSSKRERLDKMHLTKPWHGNEDDFTHHCLRDLCHFHTGDHSVNTNRPNLRSLKGKGIKRIHSFKTTTKQGKVLKCHRSHYCLDCSLETAICCESSFWWLGGA